MFASCPHCRAQVNAPDGAPVVQCWNCRGTFAAVAPAPPRAEPPAPKRQVVRYEGWPVPRAAVVLSAIAGMWAAFMPWRYAIWPDISRPGTADVGVLSLGVFFLVLLAAGIGDWSRPINPFAMAVCITLGFAAMFLGGIGILMVHEVSRGSDRADDIHIGAGVYVTVLAGILCIVFTCLPWIGPQRVDVEDE